MELDTAAGQVIVEEAGGSVINYASDETALQFETSPRVVHKRSTSQNMPIWGHKQSSSDILSYV